MLTEKQGKNPFGSSAKTVSYSYDSGGNSTQIDYPSGFEAHRTFDALSRLTAIDDGNAVDVADWDLYGTARRRDVVTFGNSTTATTTYPVLFIRGGFGSIDFRDPPAPAALLLQAWRTGARPPFPHGLGLLCEWGEPRSRLRRAPAARPGAAA